MAAVNPNVPGSGGSVSLPPSFLTPPSTSTTKGFDPPQLQGAHGVMVGIMLMVIVLVILVEVAGVSSKAAEATGLLLLGPLLLLGINNSDKFATWAGNNPIS
jgi:hypothetical protein